MSTEININRSNYESFVIDFIDGNLNAEEMSCFKKFLLTNPDIAEEVEDIQDTILTPTNVPFEAKDHLKKKPVTAISGIDENNYEEIFIASYEDELTSNQKSDLDKFLTSNPELHSEYELHRKLKVIPNPEIIFSHKGELKHKQRIAPHWYSSAAAVVLLMTSLWFFSNQNEFNDRETLTGINSIKTKTSNLLETTFTEITYNIPSRTIRKIKLPSEDIPEIIPIRTYISKLNKRNYNYRLVVNDEIEIITPSHNVLAVVNSSDEQIPKKKKKQTLFASVLNYQWNKIKSGIRSISPENEKSNDPTYVQVLSTGIMVFNTITGSETYTSKSYNTNGELVGYQIEGQEVLLSKSTHAGSTE